MKMTSMKITSRLFRILSMQFFVSVVALITATIGKADTRANLSVSSASSTSSVSSLFLGRFGCLIPGYDDHCERWASVYDNPNGHTDDVENPYAVEEARAQAISPDGTRVYVTGYSWDNSTQSLQWATVAFDTSTGAQQWVARYGEAGIPAAAYDIVVSPDGSRIYVAGVDVLEEIYIEGTVIAYDAATGDQLWLAHHAVPPDSADFTHLAISPDGATVYASGQEYGEVVRDVTIAYAASTGDQEWTAFHEDSFLYTMASDPTGARVYLAGDGGIVAYDATTGAVVWEISDQGRSLAVAPDGSQLFATRQRGVIGGDFDLVAYAAATGESTWSYALPHTLDSTPPLAGDAARVYVATTQDVPGPYLSNINVVTMAFEANSGLLAWSTDYDDPRFLRGELGTDQLARGLTASPDGKRLYLAARAGRTMPQDRLFPEDISTVAYNAADGSQKWVARYHASPNDSDVHADPFPAGATHGIGVTPDGSKVIVPGVLNHHPGFSPLPNRWYPNNIGDWSVLAYDTAVTPAVRALKAVSRKVHGAAGAFDLVGFECRSGGPDQSHQMVITFPSAVTFGSAAITSGTGSVASTSINGAEVIINLTGVANAQTIKLTLFGVSDGVHTNNVSVVLSVLLGDVTGSGFVSTLDGDYVEARSGQPLTTANFRDDLTADGVIDGTDVSLAESNIGTHVPLGQLQ